MRTKAAVIRGVPGEYEIVELELEGPRQGELLVRMVSSGLCHSDDHIATGDLPTAVYPFAGGHEGCGVIEEVGEHTPGWAVGDHVVFSFVPSCGKCRWCAQGMQNLCDLGANMLYGSRFDDITSYRLSLEGKPVGQMAGLSTFSEYTTVSVQSAIKVSKSVPLERLCLLGCGVSTGWGSAVNSAAIGPGDHTVIMGIGGIGTSAVQGAVHAGAESIVAVDPVEFKRESALKFGATDAVATMAEATELVRSRTNGQGADSAIVTVGVTTGQHVNEALGAVRKGGNVVVTGAGPYEVKDMPINLCDLTMMQKRISGALFGAASPWKTIPQLIQLYIDGRLRLDEMVTKVYSIDEIAAGFRDMHAGTIIRGVVDISPIG